MLIQILVDQPNSWVIPYAQKLHSAILEKGISCALIQSHDEIIEGDILVLLSCEQILKKFELNKYNLVIHASDLPKGRGWSPLTWKILEGQNIIPLTLFEAVKNVDAGRVYLRDSVTFEGHELIDELRSGIGEKSNEMILSFIEKYPNIIGEEQQGEPTYYSKRSPVDSELDLNKSILEQFNLLRVQDNIKYPSFFLYMGFKYLIKIEKADEPVENS